VALAAVCSNAMNDYSGSLALQTLGVRMPRPLAAALAAALGFPLVLWMHAADTTARFQNVLLFVGYWIPGFVAIVVVDWIARGRERGDAPVDVAVEMSRPRSGWPSLVAFVAAFGAAVPFMDTGLYVGPVADALHGADLSYYAPLRLRRRV
jgi:NCS1 family nucleobase:cation symporter-1